MMACARGHDCIARRLCQMAGIDVNCREEIYDRTALHIAVSRNHLGCVEALAGVAGVDWNVKAEFSILMSRFDPRNCWRQLSYAIKNQLGHPKP